MLWIGFLLYWQIKAADSKATERLELAVSRIVRSVVFLGAIAYSRRTAALVPFVL